MSTKLALRQRLTREKLRFDGAFGTYYAQRFDTRELPELANTLHPERVLEIHREYIRAGAQIIRTNTYASNTFSLDLPWEAIRENLRQGFRLAKKAAEGTDVLVAADVGQIPYESYSGRAEAAAKEYLDICRTLLEEGADCFVFETLADLEDLREAIDLVGERAFVVVQFSVNQFGYSHAGLSARKLIQRAEAIPAVDAVGFNCGVGPGHMQKIIREVPFTGTKFRTALPNAGYPQYVGNRMTFHDRNIDYFADKVRDMAQDGGDLLGGCCGTTPVHIQALTERLSTVQPQRPPRISVASHQTPPAEDHAFFAGKTGKLIAVELAPPMGSDDKALMDAAHLLKKSGADVLTFPDSPSGRTRADSILMAEKVARETGMAVMPHICCRDKNAIAMRSQILGAYLNHIDNFLVVTGDPIPSLVRNSVKSVFNFDSVGLMGILNDMNEDQFAAAPITYGGAVNQSRMNQDFEIRRVKKKMAAGATFFLSQPASTRESIQRLRRIKEETGARILCGIMPFVSLRNALFIKNEMTGIQVTGEVLARYRADMTREEGEAAGVQLAREMIALSEDFADGYYFSFPFNRVGMLEKILEK